MNTNWLELILHEKVLMILDKIFLCGTRKNPKIILSGMDGIYIN